MMKHGRSLKKVASWWLQCVVRGSLCVEFVKMPSERGLLEKLETTRTEKVQLDNSMTEWQSRGRVRHVQKTRKG